jgi:tRNA (guanosine-2'-O-)-methyltransferase
MIQSLNVSVACAVSLYEAFRQRIAKGKRQKLTVTEIETLLQEWSKSRKRVK